jgi:hypothetical protein
MVAACVALLTGFGSLGHQPIPADTAGPALATNGTAQAPGSTPQPNTTAEVAATQAADNATTLAQLAAGATAQAAVGTAVAENAATAAAPSTTSSPEIGADQFLVAPGACTMLRWNVEDAQAVLLDGAGVEARGEKRVCPGAATAYTWHIVRADGTEEERGLVIAVGAAPVVVADFIAQAPAAEWVSAHGTYYLTWNGPSEDSNGCAAWRDNPVLEDGSTPARVLLTVPNRSPGGETLGDFKLPEPIQAGDHLRARIGFLKGYPAGRVEFRLMVHGVGVHQTLTDSVENGADGLLSAIDADLTPYAGLQEITLAVRAGASPDQDAAVWIEARIERP